MSFNLVFVFVIIFIKCCYNYFTQIPSNCRYYKEITVENPISLDLTNTEVLLVIYVNDLIRNKKMNATTMTCETDIHILEDSDDYGSTFPFIPFWMENSCDHPFSRIYFEVNLPPNAIKTFYFYYGCRVHNFDLSNNEIKKFSDNFLMMNNGDCPLHYTRFDTIDSKLLRASSVYEEQLSHNPFHYHTISTTTEATLQFRESAFESNSILEGNSASHVHVINGETNVDSYFFPKFYTVNFCKHNKLDITKGSMFLFDGSPPDGFSRKSGAYERFIFGSSQTGNEGGSDTHVHGYTFNSRSTTQNALDIDSLVNKYSVSVYDHKHIITGISVPPYYSFLLAEVDYFEKFGIKFLDIDSPNQIFFAVSKPPFGFKPFTGPFTGHFIRIDNDNNIGDMDGSFVHTHAGNNLISRNCELSMAEASSKGECDPNCGNFARHNHNHEFSYETEEFTKEYPFIGVPFFTRSDIIVRTIVSEERFVDPNDDTTDTEDTSDDTVADTTQPDDDSDTEDVNDTNGNVLDDDGDVKVGDVVEVTLSILFGISLLICFIIANLIILLIYLKKNKKKDFSKIGEIEDVNENLKSFDQIVEENKDVKPKRIEM